MNLLHLRYFSELARRLHYSRTAEALCITQPTLSYAIRELEKELGVPLFERNGRNVRLTRYGQAFQEIVDRSLTGLDAGIAKLQQVRDGGGEIRLGFLRGLGVDLIPGLAEGFLREVPDSGIRFSFHSGPADALLEGLRAGTYDLVFASRPTSDERFLCTPVWQQDLVVIVPKGHPLAGRGTVALRETLPYPQIVFAEGTGLRRVIRQMFREIGGQPVIAYEVQEDQVVAGLVAHGFGIAVVPAMEMLHRLDVEILTIAEPQKDWNFYLISNRQGYQPPAVFRFRRYVEQRTGEKEET